MLTDEKLALEESLKNSDVSERLSFIDSELKRLLKFDKLTKDILAVLVEKIEVTKEG